MWRVALPRGCAAIRAARARSAGGALARAAALAARGGDGGAAPRARPHRAGLARLRASAHARVGHRRARRGHALPHRRLDRVAARRAAGAAAGCSLLPLRRLRLRDAGPRGDGLARHPGGLVGRVGSAKIYVGSSHDLLTVAWHCQWFAIPVAISVLLVLGLIWRRGYLTVGFIRRQVFDPTTLPLYGALVAQALAQVLDVEDRLLSRRHPFLLPVGGALRAARGAAGGDRPAAEVLPRITPSGI